MLGYIGPGGGFAVSFSLLTVALVLLSIVLGPIVFPLAMLWHALRGRRVMFRYPFRKVIVLGLDGLDPKIVRGLMERGKLPHLSSLASSGHFSDLQTVAPALTPAAWPSFMTGNDPSRHGIYDFIDRDLKTYLPRLSSTDIAEPRHTLRFGKFRIPLTPARPRMLRKGIPFWRVLGRHGLEVTVLRVPITFPPEPFRGRVLSGMCVPDLRGTQGTFTYFATHDERLKPGDEDFVSLEFVHGLARAVINGPWHPWIGSRQLSLPLLLRRLPAGRGLEVKAGATRVRLEAGRLSEWVTLRFRAGALTVRGMVQFYLRSCDDDRGVHLYMTPVQIDPESPAMTVSHPAVFSNYLAKRSGPFATLGFVEDTSALNNGVLDEAGFLRQAWSAFANREAMFLKTLEDKSEDLTVCVFDTPDRIQHMFWRYVDDEHPALSGHANRAHADTIEQMVVRMDELVGRTIERLPKDALLLVISDHGFTSFRRGVNLNAWLRCNGYLHLIPGADLQKEWLEAVDWSRTRAYAMGLVGIFINLRGREGRGIVEAGDEFNALVSELKAGLLALEDDGKPGGSRAVRRVTVPGTEYTGPYRMKGPDLLVGYQPGYRCSWECARGQVTEDVFSDNVRAWSGDHCVDPATVPGVLFANTSFPAARARLIDIAPTILDVFGVEPEAQMQGSSLLRGTPATTGHEPDDRPGSHHPGLLAAGA